ncbi:MAG: DUF6531 domain-containing protein, partial [Litorilituus sp.]|nr:DUF6531 domain-containing protein [Litorilituus sp.]
MKHKIRYLLTSLLLIFNTYPINQANALDDTEIIEITGYFDEYYIAMLINGADVRYKHLSYLLNHASNRIVDPGLSDSSDSCSPVKGNPIMVSTGDKVESEVDIITQGQYPLTLSRHYSSGASVSNFDGLGISWTFNVEPKLYTSGSYPQVYYHNKKIAFENVDQSYDIPGVGVRTVAFSSNGRNYIYSDPT